MMKKSYFSLFLLTASLLLTGCAADKSAGPELRTYAYTASEEPVKPTLQFQEDGQVQFSYSVLSSQILCGAYEVQDDSLLLKAEGDSGIYVFRLNGEFLTFDAKASPKLPGFASIPDGAVFR